MQSLRNPQQSAYIVDAIRTPVGRGHADKGMYRDIHPADLLGRTFVGLLDHAGLDPAAVDNVIAGCVHQVGEHSSGITRTAWLMKGLPIETGATTVDIRCGSGQQATNYAALTIEGGINEIVVSGGVESMTRVGFRVNEGSQKQYGQAFPPELFERFPIGSQGLGAEMLAEQWKLSREDLDSFSARSHARAAEATDSGAFKREILPIETAEGMMTEDQGIRRGTSVETLANLATVFKEGGVVTAGNASQISDGAAAILLASEAAAAKHGLKRRARIVDQVVLGVDPVSMLSGPIPSTLRLLERNGLTVADIDAFEVNEAFASVALAWERELGADPDKVNPRGGAIALGHPLGSTGARLITTLLHYLEDTDKELGVVTMCCGGGLGTATLIQRT
ncbi:thiolase family protein [Sphingobium sp. DEHP117]|uniref:thiolase family protein n=1 Tax=Sphingobium sp. DEHP117 TaxID=2993436 RepID=UPI0027D55193|nr:acetyl-CoA C-acyltransferase [Sphingobium sp. DEHP117]MDQ4421565.1 thiolase family protein [Sphingobium sp. DEHP117]